jgi:integral membrane protein (TIGR01906 family)
MLVPLTIVPGTVRLLATDQYLAFEYGKSDFPQDLFGFDQSQRFSHASDNLRYIVENRPSIFLADQKHGNAPLYDTREVSHMQDVQNVFQAVWGVWKGALILFVICIALILVENNRKALASALRIGGLVTTGLFILIGISAAIAWQGWFVLFHRFFFVEGSWLFSYTDTLIRLFPQKFWFDSAITVSSLSLLGGVLVYSLGQGLSPKDVTLPAVP